jgi:hypothetical protein
MPLTAKIGWLFLLSSLFCNVFLSDWFPPDPVTTAMKRSGTYNAFVVTCCICLGAAAVVVALIVRSTARAKDELESLKKFHEQLRRMNGGRDGSPTPKSPLKGGHSSRREHPW